MSAPRKLIAEKKERLERRRDYLQSQFMKDCPAELLRVISDKIAAISNTFNTIDQIGRVLDQMSTIENGISNPELQLSFYNQIFQRFIEAELSISVIDEIWSCYLTSRNFAASGNIRWMFSEFEKEIASPLGSNRCSFFLFSNEFGYLHFANIPKNLFRIYVPFSAIENPYVWPILAHELGHAFCFLPNIYQRIETEFGPILSQHISSVIGRMERTRQDVDATRYFLSRSWYQWILEIGADLFALRRIGPAFIHSQIFEMLVFDPFSLSLSNSGSFRSTHPPHDKRIRMLIDCSKEWFPLLVSSADKYEKEWNAVSGRHQSSTLERQRELYDILCNDELLNSIIEKMKQLLSQTTPLQTIVSLPYKKALNRKPLNISNILLSALSEEIPPEVLANDIINRAKEVA